ncbi:DUF4260 family protein [Nonomuraea ceibae]|uniref:DUF4260 family protein n=1 Tax=Nonomuraea ceibae TaxID=1935170 RepID=UPI001C5FEEA9|nr:DUF4260 family protein [Nonomuraea ceibae]
MTPEHARDVPASRDLPRRTAWGAPALFLAAFAVFESVKYGLPTTAAALAFFALPSLAGLAGARPPGLVHQAVHRVWIPLAVLVGYAFGPVVWPPLFTAGLGWLTRIAVDRTFGRGLGHDSGRDPGHSRAAADGDVPA